MIHQDEERAEKLGREVDLLPANGESGAAVVKAARDGEYDLIVVPLSDGPPAAGGWAAHVLGHRTARCSWRRRRGAAGGG